jgi:hypothetical protein
MDIPDNFNNLVDGKTVALVGPGINLYNAKKGNEIDSYDLVARVGDFVILRDFDENDWGKRSDIVFSNCNDDSRTWIGSDRNFLLCNKNIKMMVGIQYSGPEAQIIADFLFGIKRDFNIDVYWFSYEQYIYCQDFCEGTPLSGINALIFLCESKCKKIKIFGFNMYNNGEAGVVYHPDISRKHMELGLHSDSSLNGHDLRFDIHRPDRMIAAFDKIKEKYKDKIEVQ